MKRVVKEANDNMPISPIEKPHITDKFLILKKKPRIVHNSVEKAQALFKIYQNNPPYNYSPEESKFDINQHFRQLQQLLKHIYHIDTKKYQLFNDYLTNLSDNSIQEIWKELKRNNPQNCIIKETLENHLFDIKKNASTVNPAPFYACNVNDCIPRAESNLQQVIDWIVNPRNIETLLVEVKEFILFDYAQRLVINYQKNATHWSNNNKNSEEHYANAIYNTIAETFELPPHEDTFATQGILEKDLQIDINRDFPIFMAESRKLLTEISITLLLDQIKSKNPLPQTTGKTSSAATEAIKDFFRAIEGPEFDQKADDPYGKWASYYMPLFELDESSYTYILKENSAIFYDAYLVKLLIEKGFFRKKISI